MSQVSITIDTDNAAFDGENWGVEIARLLKSAAQCVQQDFAYKPEEDAGFYLHDTNGNMVGEWYYEAD